MHVQPHIMRRSPALTAAKYRTIGRSGPMQTITVAQRHVCSWLAGLDLIASVGLHADYCEELHQNESIPQHPEVSRCNELN